MTRRPPAGAPSPRARALGLAVLSLLLAVPLVLSPGPPVGHGTGAAPAVAATTPAALRLTSISPDVATVGGVLRVTGEITNTGRQVLRDVEVTEVAWVPLAELDSRLAYADERRLVRRAAQILEESA